MAADQTSKQSSGRRPTCRRPRSRTRTRRPSPATHQTTRPCPPPHDPSLAVPADRLTLRQWTGRKTRGCHWWRRIRSAPWRQGTIFSTCLPHDSPSSFETHRHEQKRSTLTSCSNWPAEPRSAKSSKLKCVPTHSATSLPPTATSRATSERHGRHLLRVAHYRRHRVRPKATLEHRSHQRGGRHQP